jgi:hypothetical protein
MGEPLPRLAALVAVVEQAHRRALLEHQAKETVAALTLQAVFTQLPAAAALAKQA